MITSDKTFADALIADFKAGIATPNAISVQWPNAPFAPPQATIWCAYDLVFGDEVQIETGSTKTFRSTGVLYVRIFAPAETGAGSAIELADRIKDRYRAVTRAGAEFRAPAIASQRRDNEWWVTTVACPFYADRFA